MTILFKFSTSLFSYTWFCCCLFLLKIMSPSLISSHLLLSSFLPPSLHLYQFLSTPPTTLQSCVSRAAEQSCQKQCSPRSYQLNSYSNRTGPFVVKTIKRCHANSHHCQNCQRKPNRFYVFPNSKYHQKASGLVFSCKPWRIYSNSGTFLRYLKSFVYGMMSSLHHR